MTTPRSGATRRHAPIHPRNAPGPSAATGSRVRELRERLGASTRALGECAGVHPSHLARIERGEANPRLDTLARLASALGTSIADLVRDERTVPTGPRLTPPRSATAAPFRPAGTT